MITKEKFTELIEDYLTYDVLLNQAEGIFPNIIESKLIDFAWKWHWELIESYFNKVGKDWISWWLFERKDNPDLKAFDKDNNEIPTETIDDLWELIKEYRI